MFKIRKDAETWFRKIADKPPIKTKFDLYYMCLMLGIKNGRLDSVADGSDVYLKFPQEYEGSRFLVIGLLIAAEMKREGLDFSDRELVQEMLARYVATDVPANLSAEGFKKANSYASGGFDVLSNAIQDSPEDVNVFLALYTKLMAEADAG